MDEGGADSVPPMAYQIDTTPLKDSGSNWRSLAERIAVYAIDNEQDFNTLCRQLAAGSSDFSLQSGRQFEELIGEVQPAETNKRIPTSWGGVYVLSYDEGSKEYEKFLIVHGGKWLAFEHHDEKTETMTVEEGVGVLLYRDLETKMVAVRSFQLGDSMTLVPGQEHCLIALTNLVVREKGVDPKGMDQDLVFTYMPAE